MRILLFVLAILAFLFGMLNLLSAHSDIEELKGVAVLLISAVCLAGAGIIEAVQTLRFELLAKQPIGPAQPSPR
jgi:hypothetical protein